MRSQLNLITKHHIAEDAKVLTWANPSPGLFAIAKTGKRVSPAETALFVTTFLHHFKYAI